MNTPVSVTASTLTDKDRSRLERLLKLQKRLATARVKQRSAELKSDFESKLAAVYKPEDDEVWAKAHAQAEAAVAAANEAVQAECARLGIPERFAPKITAHWWDRGENGSKQRRDELRKVADAMIERLEKSALVAIETHALATEAELLGGSLSPAARAFLEEKMCVENLMPKLEVKQAEAPLPGGSMGQLSQRRNHGTL